LKSTNKFKGAVIVIPTRNRPDLAQNAAQSALSQPQRNVRVVVSDNSTSGGDIKVLSEFCSDLRDDRLRYIRPPTPLAMSQHWDWALQEALQSDFEHFAFLSDRMVFRPGILGQVLELVEQHPDQILTYLHDRVVDYRNPVTIDLNEWTGKLYEVTSAQLLALSADSVIYDGSFPRMLNCFVPRSVLSAIRDRFGNVFSSIAPDWNFTYRALEVVDSVLYYNAPALVHYGLTVSNGYGIHRGIENDAYRDYVRELAVITEAPFPEIITVWNFIINEYCFVKKETQSPKFPELNIEKYMGALAWGIGSMEDPEFKQHMTEKLLARGWNPENCAKPPQLSLASLPASRRVFNRLKTLTAPIAFADPDKAREYAVRHPRRKSKVVAWEEALHRGTEIPIQS
jgi:glycosyltransferase involved in cell wall biosynthesis